MEKSVFLPTTAAVVRASVCVSGAYESVVFSLVELPLTTRERRTVLDGAQERALRGLPNRVAVEVFP